MSNKLATVDDLHTAIKASADHILNVLDIMMTRIDERFQRVETRLDKHDTWIHGLAGKSGYSLPS